jgi:hypothetical protein
VLKAFSNNNHSYTTTTTKSIQNKNKRFVCNKFVEIEMENINENVVLFGKEE